MDERPGPDLGSNPLPTRWPSAAHRAWLAGESARLTEFGRASLVPGAGFGWLDTAGRLDLDQPVETYITARMTHVYALATLRGDPRGPELVDHGLAALAGPLRDHDHDGWFEGIARRDHKSAYAHAFVVLAASSATLAERPGSRDLLDAALAVVEARFLGGPGDPAGTVWDTYSADWSERDDYRGANSAMHLVEALLAAGDATEDGRWARAALAVAADSVHGQAPGQGWLIPEHRAGDGTPVLDYNADHRDDQFKPYGATPGHSFEWARLLLSVEAALAGLGDEPPPWLLADSEALFAKAVEVGFLDATSEGDGSRAGFPYTVDWDGAVVVPARFHWVAAEAISAAAVLHRRTGGTAAGTPYADWYARWWELAQADFVDLDGGSWWHEVGPDGRPEATVWAGKPDIYHAYQATLIPLQPPSASLAGALAIPPPL